MKYNFQKNSIDKETKKVFSKTIFYSAGIILAIFVTNLIFIGIVYSSPTLDIYLKNYEAFDKGFGENLTITPNEIQLSVWLGFGLFITGLTVFLASPFMLTKSKKQFKFTFPILMITLFFIVCALISMTASEVSYDKLTKLVNYITTEGVVDEIEKGSNDENLTNAVKELFNQNESSKHFAWSTKSLGWIISLLKVVVITAVYSKTFFDHAALTTENAIVSEQIDIKTKKGYIGKNKLHNLFTKITILNQRNICLWVFILVFIIVLPQVIYIGSVLNRSSSLGSMFSWNLYLSDLLTWVKNDDVKTIIGHISDDEINNLNVITVQTAMIMGVISMLFVMPIYFVRNWNVEDKVVGTQSFALITLSSILVTVNFYSMFLLSRASTTWNNNIGDINKLIFETPAKWNLTNSIDHIKELCGIGSINPDGSFNFGWPIGVELIALLIVSLLALLIITIVLIRVFRAHTTLIRTNTSTHYFEDEEWY
ncbi:hypothetical protein [Spiroplasma endosymbiont of Othius punctulatus]|uniref:hypothetical protein n=1 Tax=Spiroplasma endosymbiont of Othius punctulatus TaxID=3066289 RepID=UPI0030D48EB2